MASAAPAPAPATALPDGEAAGSAGQENATGDPNSEAFIRDQFNQLVGFWQQANPAPLRRRPDLRLEILSRDAAGRSAPATSISTCSVRSGLRRVVVERPERPLAPTAESRDHQGISRHARVQAHRHAEGTASTTEADQRGVGERDQIGEPLAVRRRRILRRARQASSSRHGSPPSGAQGLIRSAHAIFQKRDVSQDDPALRHGDPPPMHPIIWRGRGRFFVSEWPPREEDFQNIEQDRGAA